MSYSTYKYTSIYHLKSQNNKYYRVIVKVKRPQSVEHAIRREMHPPKKGNIRWVP